MTERETKEWRKEMIRLVRGTKRRKVMFEKLLAKVGDSFKEKEFFRAYQCCKDMASLCWEEYRAENHRKDKEGEKKFEREMKNLKVEVRKAGAK